MKCTMCDDTGQYMTVDPFGCREEYMIDCKFCTDDLQAEEDQWAKILARIYD